MEVETNTPALDDCFINEHEVAQLIAVSVKTLRQARWRGSKDYPPFKKNGRNVRYLKSEVLTYMHKPSVYRNEEKEA